MSQWLRQIQRYIVYCWYAHTKSSWGVCFYVKVIYSLLVSIYYGCRFHSARIISVNWTNNHLSMCCPVNLTNTLALMSEMRMYECTVICQMPILLCIWKQNLFWYWIKQFFCICCILSSELNENRIPEAKSSKQNEMSETENRQTQQVYTCNRRPNMIFFTCP